jgi:hypothetical protein
MITRRAVIRRSVIRSSGNYGTRLPTHDVAIILRRAAAIILARSAAIILARGAAV